MARAVEIALLAIAVLYPVYAVVRLRLLGIPLGGVVFWLAIGAADYVPMAMDRRRAPSPGSSLWLIAGLPSGLFYSAIIMTVRLLIEVYLPRKGVAKPRASDPEPSAPGP